jgi:hypothetical protein
LNPPDIEIYLFRMYDNFIHNKMGSQLMPVSPTSMVINGTTVLVPVGTASYFKIAPGRYMLHNVKDL